MKTIGQTERTRSQIGKGTFTLKNHVPEEMGGHQVLDKELIMLGKTGPAFNAGEKVTLREII